MEPQFRIETEYTEKGIIQAAAVIHRGRFLFLRVLFAAMAALLLFQAVRLLAMLPRAAVADYGRPFLFLIVASLALAAVLVFFIFRWPAFLVKRNLRRSGVFSLGLREILFFEDGYESRSERQIAKLLYGQISYARETKTDFYLVSGGLTVMLPKKDFAKGTPEEFRAFLKGKIPEGARCNF